MISPINNARLYTDGGEDTPRFIDIEAKFEAHETGLYESLSNTIIYNESNNNAVVKTYGGFLNIPWVRKIGGRFKTSNSREYKIVFTIVNREGTKRTETINVTCVYSEL